MFKHELNSYLEFLAWDARQPGTLARQRYYFQLLYKEGQEDARSSMGEERWAKRRAIDEKLRMDRRTVHRIRIVAAAARCSSKVPSNSRNAAQTNSTARATK